MTILNLTQHAATVDQKQAGVVDYHDTKTLQELLTFTSMPCPNDVTKRAKAIADLIVPLTPKSAMIGGAPYLMPALTNELKERGIKVLFAYSERVSEEVVQEDGSVKKINVFKHLGFVEA